MRYAVSRVLGDAGDDHSGVAVANENGTPEILTRQQRNHVADVCIQRHGFSELASVSFQSRKRSDDDLSAGAFQSGRNQIPCGGSLHCTVDARPVSWLA